MKAKRRSVGARELKNRTSAVLRRVKGGEPVTVTERNRPVAVLIPLAHAGSDEHLRALVDAGAIAWAGGKPRGAARPAAVRGRTVADAVVEDRR